MSNLALLSSKFRNLKKSALPFDKCFAFKMSNITYLPAKEEQFCNDIILICAVLLVIASLLHQGQPPPPPTVDNIGHFYGKNSIFVSQNINVADETKVRCRGLFRIKLYSEILCIIFPNKRRDTLRV